jgi:CxxC motif-containing protein (DUF1111 family)
MKFICLVIGVLGAGILQAETIAVTRAELLAIPLSAELGGELTVVRQDKEAFKQMTPNAGPMRFPQFLFGQRQFTTEWDPAPGQVPATDGLGPTFNAIACASCHINNGRGRPPVNDEAFESILVRLSIPGDDGHGGPAPLGSYGGQLQHRAVADVTPEGTAIIEWQEVTGEFADGTRYKLRKPEVRFTDLAYGDMPVDAMYSLRIANPVMGLGLLETVPDAILLSLADPEDANNDGISGRMNVVWDPVSKSKTSGRFGWKANVPSLSVQSAGAALGDMGITTTLNPDNNCPPPQQTCLEAVSLHPDELEFRPEFFDQLVRYMQLLAVPQQRDAATESVQRGQALFYASGCVQCHMPTLQTGTNEEFPELAEQTIHPFTDLLLHDMGAGLADGRPDYAASGDEWRTPPLWGLGLSETVAGHSTLLHDGRARSVTEAILWHGGEAATAQERFRQMDEANRAALLAFLQSL